MKLKAPFPYFGGKSRVAAYAVGAVRAARAAFYDARAASFYDARADAYDAQIKMVAELGNPFKKEPINENR